MAPPKKSSTQPSLPKPRYHHGDLRRALLDEATVLMREGGTDAVRMNVLARRLGVSVAAPFRHFESREALLVELVEQGATRMAQAMDLAAAQQTDPLQAQRARGVAYVRFCVEEPVVFRLLQRPEIVGASQQLRILDAQQRAAMEPVLSAGHDSTVSRVLAQRSAGLLAAQALTLGLAQMMVDGLLGTITPDAAAALAWEVTGVLGAGLVHMASDSNEELG